MSKSSSYSKTLIGCAINILIGVAIFNWLTPLHVKIIDNPDPEATIGFKIVLRSDNYEENVVTTEEHDDVKKPIQPNAPQDPKPIEEDENESKSKYDNDMFR